jgi:hypothetical protein
LDRRENQDENKEIGRDRSNRNRECAGGPYDNSVKNFFDYVAKWMNARFPARAGS